MCHCRIGMYAPLTAVTRMVVGREIKYSVHKALLSAIPLFDTMSSAAMMSMLALMKVRTELGQFVARPHSDILLCLSK